MKKIYFLCLLFCTSIAAKAQTTIFVYASGPSGSYTTGSSIETLPAATYVTNDGTIAVTNSTTSRQAGYAVFNLPAIPVGATISEVLLGVYRSGFTTGLYGTCTTIGHVANFGTIGAGALGPIAGSTLYTDCTTTPFAGDMTLWNATTGAADGSYGTYPGVYDTTMISTPGATGAACTFIQTSGESATGKIITISFSVASGTTNVYNFMGEIEPLDTGTAFHAPYLMITYCFQPTAVTATATPNPICSGDPLTLSGGATGASLYKWSGPGGFTATTLTATDVAPSTGVYTLTAYANCGTFMDSTLVNTGTVTVNASPSAITTATTTVCQGNIINMTDATHGGAWSSSNTTVATIDGTGDVYGVNTGIAVISYTLGACPATDTVHVNDPPGPISGPTAVCASGGTITLMDGVGAGTWSSSNTTLATVNPISGLVTGISAGPVTIDYLTGACSSVTYPITVDPLPTAITGANVVCVNATLSLSDGTAGGTWSSNNTSLATVAAGPGNTGIVTGISASTVVITYTIPTGCYITTSVVVNPIPASITGPAAVCVGLAVTLSDATAGGTWSSSNTTIATVGSSTGKVSGVSANGVNITYTLPVTGCYNIDAFTVDPLPNNIAGPVKVCVNDSITLSDATAGGAWSSQLTSVATADPVAGTVTGVAAGVSYITYSIGTTSCYTTFSVTVNPLPTAAITPAGPTTFCAGGSVTLNATVAGGDTYQWFANGTAIAAPAGTANSYTANSTEGITVQITDGNGCVNTSSVTQVTLVQNATITAGGPVVFCQPQNVLLSVPLAPGLLYQWTLNGANIPGANANTYYAAQNGIYTCYLEVPGGCSSTTPAFTVTVHLQPIPVVTYSGGQLTTTNGFVSYQWYLNSVAIAGATTTSVTPTVNGNYIVRVVDGNGCVGYSSTFVIDNLDVQQINKTDIKIYPNPTNSIVHIESPVMVRAIVTDIEGKTLLEVTDAKDINISSFPDGLYMIMLYDDNGDRLVVQKLVKE